MTDRELEAKLRAWYGSEVGEVEAVPLSLRRDILAIPRASSGRASWLGRRSPRTWLLVAATLAISGGAIGAALVGGGLLGPRPTPSHDAVIVDASESPAAAVPSTSPTASPAANVRPGSLIAYIHAVTVPSGGTVHCGYIDPPTCQVPRVWIVGADGSGAHELIPGGLTGQYGVSWTPDGAHLLYFDGESGGELRLADPTGGASPVAGAGCVTSCDASAYNGASLSGDGTRVAFNRNFADGANAIEIMDLASGRVSQLSATVGDGGWQPGWSPDGTRLTFSRAGNTPNGGPTAERLPAVFVIDADGANLRQLTAPALQTESPSWSPDGSRIVFTSRASERSDVYTVLPDGTDVQQLTTDGISWGATWTPDGRLLFARAAAGEAPALWTMNADGSAATLLVSALGAGTSAGDLTWYVGLAAWQPLGGPSIAAMSWTPTTATPVGPPPPTPAATPMPALSAGFSWTGPVGMSHQTSDAGPIAAFNEATSATLLHDGRVLVLGRCSTEARLFDSATGTFSQTSPPATARGAYAATVLQDGRVLLTGGGDCTTSHSDGTWATAEIYDPATGAWTPTGSMTVPRFDHTSTLLADGRVLITGGQTGAPPTTADTVVLASYHVAVPVDGTAPADTGANVLATAEVYDPATGAFTATGSMHQVRDRHTATLLEDGRVLVLGGGGEGHPPTSLVELYDPATGRFTTTGSLHYERWLQTATRLADGRVLITGGSSSDTTLASAELYDPGTGRFTVTGSMGSPRQEQTATLLDDGRVLVAGGLNGASAELYDPVTGRFIAAGSIGEPRVDHSAVRLADGRVLLVGGNDGHGNTSTTAVLYRP